MPTFYHNATESITIMLSQDKTYFTVRCPATASKNRYFTPTSAGYHTIAEMYYLMTLHTKEETLLRELAPIDSAPLYKVMIATLASHRDSIMRRFHRLVDTGVLRDPQKVARKPRKRAA